MMQTEDRNTTRTGDTMDATQAIYQMRPGVIAPNRSQPYLGGKIQLTAAGLGWPAERLCLGYKHKDYEDRTLEAQCWLSGKTKRRGYRFGFNARSDWGLFRVDDTAGGSDDALEYQTSNQGE